METRPPLFTLAGYISTNLEACCPKGDEACNEPQRAGGRRVPCCAGQLLCRGAFGGLPRCYGNRGFCLYILRAAASFAGPVPAAQPWLQEGNAELTQSQCALPGFCGLRSLCFLFIVRFFSLACEFWSRRYVPKDMSNTGRYQVILKEAECSLKQWLISVYLCTRRFGL